jgi:hypothetical protein
MHGRSRGIVQGEWEQDLSWEAFQKMVRSDRLFNEAVFSLVCDSCQVHIGVNKIGKCLISDL